MFGFFRSEADAVFNALYKPSAVALPPARSVTKVSDLAASYPTRSRWDDGEKFAGGYGPTILLQADYWTLRARSAELFESNIYGRGVIRRLVTNEINTGLHLEAIPEEGVLGLEEEALLDWSELTENRFTLWARDPRLCDSKERLTFGALQQAARTEALVAGDVLVVIVQDRRTRLPRVRLIRGEAVQTPLKRIEGGNKIVHGVELDSSDRQVAYWIRKDDGTAQRLPAFGEKSGRRLAWLLYGTDSRLDDVRGKPLLSLILQSLKEVDRYRDSVQRKAVINSMLAMFISKGEAKPGSKPIGKGAVRRGIDTAVDSTGTERSFRAAELIPGLIIDELQQGEEPKGFPSHGTDEKFGDFERSIIQSVAWCLEIPPEILMLAFNSNYSASRAANNEFEMYLLKARTNFGDQFCQPLYVDWLLSETLSGKIKAPGLLEAWRTPTQYDLFAAWINSDWAGQIKPAIDAGKLVSAYKEAISEGLITRSRAARELNGTKAHKNIKILKRENEELRAANMPIAELEAASKPAAPERPEPGKSKPAPVKGMLDDDTDPDAWDDTQEVN